MWHRPIDIPTTMGEGTLIDFRGVGGRGGRELFRNYQLVHPRRQRKVGLVLQPATTRLSHAGYLSVEKGVVWSGCGVSNRWQVWSLGFLTDKRTLFTKLLFTRLSIKSLIYNILIITHMYHVCIIEWIIIWCDEVIMYLIVIKWSHVKTDCLKE